MDFLKSQFDRIQRQLAGLSATQKMLTASLVAIMVITVVWWGRYAGESEMVPLLDQSFSTDDLGRIQLRLDAKGVRYSTSGEKILVPAERRMEVLSDLTYARMMPRNTQAGFDEIIKQMSPFDSNEKQEKIWNHGKELLLSRIIGNFPEVVQADVIIDPTSISRIQGSVEPSATVNVALRDGAKVTQRLVDAAADAVAGAQSGLSQGRIKVVVNGLARRVRDAETNPLDGGGSLLELAQQNEVFLEDKIRQTFGDIGGLLVSVKVKINVTTMQTEKHDFDGKGAVQKETQSSNQTEETNTPVAPAGGEGGAIPNTGIAIPNAGGGAGQTQNNEKSEQKFQNFVPETHSLSKTPAGEATTLGATVRIPLSYFARIMQQDDSSVQHPTLKQLEPIVQQWLPRLKEEAAASIALAPDKVVMYTYPDAAPLAPVAAGSIPSVTLLMGGHAKEIALGALAVMSLFMASMMVRKGTPAPVVAIARPAAPPAPPQVLMAGEPLAGEAASGDSTLDAMELTEETIKAQQMVDQVSTMVRENPDAAASLVKRWLNRS